MGKVHRWGRNWGVGLHAALYISQMWLVSWRMTAKLPFWRRCCSLSQKLMP